MNNKSSGEKFKIALLILFFAVLIGEIISLFTVDKISVTYILLLIVVAYVSYLPVLFADVLWKIEENTRPTQRKESANISQSVDISKENPASCVYPKEKLPTYSKDERVNISCPRCGALQKKDRTSCSQCGTKFATEEEVN